MSIAVAIAGATGRLGRVIDDVVTGLPDFEVIARLDHSTGLSALDAADVVIDATRIDVSERVVARAVEGGAKIVVATSGWDRERIRTLESTVATHPDAGVLIVPNFSVGSVLSTGLAAQAAKLLPNAEIIEAHHIAKVDAPSGTAVRTAEQIDAARGDHSKAVAIHSVRLPGIIARQTVILGGEGEYLTITHETTSSDSYRAGIAKAVTAAPSLTGVTLGLDALLGLA